MALSFVKLFQPLQLGIAATTIYTMPAGPATTVLKNARLRLSNTSANPVAATLYAVPSGGAAGLSNVCFPSTSIAANGYIDVDIPDLQINDFVQGLAGTAAVITVQSLGGVLYS